MSTLKPTVCPWSTLMSVAKPWIVEDPAPVMPHSLSGLPGRVFSHAIGLVTGASHGAAVAGADSVTTDRTVETSRTGRNAAHRRGRSTAQLLHRGPTDPPCAETLPWSPQSIVVPARGAVMPQCGQVRRRAGWGRGLGSRHGSPEVLRPGAPRRGGARPVRRRRHRHLRAAARRHHRGPRAGSCRGWSTRTATSGSTTTGPSTRRRPRRRPCRTGTRGRCWCATAARRRTPRGSTTARTCPGSSGPVATSPAPAATSATTPTRWSRRRWSRPSPARPGPATAGSSWSATGSRGTRATWPRASRPTTSPPRSPPPTSTAPR